MLKVTFDTTDYQRSHSRKPSGHGLWMFEATASDGHGAHLSLGEFSHTGTLTEAKREAKAHYRSEAQLSGRARSVTVFVQP